MPVPVLPQDNSRVGPYRLLQELGRGGQAVVWLAEDTRIARRVALKLLAGLAPGSDASLQRFRREAEAASRLEHPVICPVLEADLAGQLPYIAMRFVDGQTLARHIAQTRAAGGTAVVLGDRGPADFQAIATLFAKIARALHLAHEAGIVHRDIKPANLMVTPEREPVILDFGLERHDDAEAHGQSVTGEHSGTPSYMSPEQLNGRARPDRRSDVYSLGCTLYECLTGRPPFAAPTLEGLFRAILESEARDARALHAEVPFDLAVIAATALQKDRERRYKSALDLAEDLERFVRLEPIAARPVGRAERAVRWMRRNPTLAASFAGLAVLAIVATGLLSYGIGAAGRAELQAQLAAQAEQARERAVAEQQRLVQAAADRDLAGRIDELQMKLGTLLYGMPGGSRAVPSLLPGCTALLREAGVDLEQPDARARNERAVRELAGRDADAARALLDLLKTLTEAAAGLPLGTLQNLHALLAAFETAWEREFAAARERYERDQVDEFAPFLREHALAELTPDQLAELARWLFGVPARRDAAYDLLDRALLARPDSFALHYLRAGIGLYVAGSTLQQAGERAEDPAARKQLVKAIEHFRAAMALRPRSGLARGALAGALAFQAHVTGDLEGFQVAWRVMESATKVDPGNALVWYMHASYLSRIPGGRGKQGAIASCRKALELDPALALAQDLLAELSK